MNRAATLAFPYVYVPIAINIDATLEYKQFATAAIGYPGGDTDGCFY